MTCRSFFLSYWSWCTIGDVEKFNLWELMSLWLNWILIFFSVRAVRCLVPWSFDLWDLIRNLGWDPSKLAKMLNYHACICLHQDTEQFKTNYFQCSAQHTTESNLQIRNSSPPHQSCISFIFILHSRLEFKVRIHTSYVSTNFSRYMIIAVDLMEENETSTNNKEFN